MNIVWIEDFGGTQPLPANSKTLIPLFQGILSREIFVKKWDDEDDLLTNTHLLSDFFSEHSIHRVLLLKNVFDYLDKVGSQDIARHDVFIIDINLTLGVDLERALPDGMEEIKEKPTFHQKAGFFIYNHLIRLGVSAENICLLTGEHGSTVEFNTHCRDSLTPRPVSFEKSDSGYSAFRAWLNGHQANDYLTLRRAVIEGCDFLKGIIKSDESAIQFRLFIRPEQGKPSRDVTLEEMCDYLDTLRQFLPETRPTDIAGINRVCRLFVRTLAHEWESQADPEYPRNQPNYGVADRRLLPTLGWIMKNVRNWMSHNNAINNLDARNVAFLFIVNMRAMFHWDVAPARFEKQALSLLATGDERAPESLDELALQSSLVRTYKRMRDLIQEKKLPESRHFAYMINNLAQAGVGEVDYVQALYQMYWHGLVPASFGQFKERESDKGKRQHFLQMFCNFNFDTNRFRATPSGQDDFFYQLALTIYPHSFQG